MSWSLILFRKHLGAYAVYAGSDFDLDGALTSALNSLRGIDLGQLRGLAGLQPILAKRHYHETGALRWFEVDLITLADVARVASAVSESDGAIGRFLLAIPTENENGVSARRLCQEAAQMASGDVVVGTL